MTLDISETGCSENDWNLNILSLKEREPLLMQLKILCTLGRFIPKTSKQKMFLEIFCFQTVTFALKNQSWQKWKNLCILTSKEKNYTDVAENTCLGKVETYQETPLQNIFLKIFGF